MIFTSDAAAAAIVVVALFGLVSLQNNYHYYHLLLMTVALITLMATRWLTFWRWFPMAPLLRRSNPPDQPSEIVRHFCLGSVSRRQHAAEMSIYCSVRWFFFFWFNKPPHSTL